MVSSFFLPGEAQGVHQPGLMAVLAARIDADLNQDLVVHKVRVSAPLSEIHSALGLEAAGYATQSTELNLAALRGGNAALQRAFTLSQTFIGNYRAHDLLLRTNPVTSGGFVVDLVRATFRALRLLDRHSTLDKIKEPVHFPLGTYDQPGKDLVFQQVIGQLPADAISAEGKQAHFYQFLVYSFLRRDFAKHCTSNFLYTVAHLINIYVDKVQALTQGVNLDTDKTAFRGVQRPLAQIASVMQQIWHLTTTVNKAAFTAARVPYAPARVDQNQRQIDEVPESFGRFPITDEFYKSAITVIGGGRLLDPLDLQANPPRAADVPHFPDAHDAHLTELFSNSRFQATYVAQAQGPDTLTGALVNFLNRSGSTLSLAQLLVGRIYGAAVTQHIEITVMADFTHYHKSFNIREILLDAYPLAGLVPQAIIHSEDVADTIWQFFYVVIKLHSSPALLVSEKKLVEGVYHDPALALQQHKLASVQRAKDLTLRAKLVINTQLDENLYDFGTIINLGMSNYLQWDTMTTFQKLHFGVWNDFRLQFLPLYLLAGDDQTLTKELDNFYAKGIFPGDGDIRKLIDQGKKNDGLPDTAKKNFKNLAQVQKLVSFYDFGYEHEVFGLTTRTGAATNMTAQSLAFNPKPLVQNSQNPTPRPQAVRPRGPATGPRPMPPRLTDQLKRIVNTSGLVLAQHEIDHMVSEAISDAKKHGNDRVKGLLAAQNSIKAALNIYRKVGERGKESITPQPSDSKGAGKPNNLTKEALKQLSNLKTNI